MQLRRVLRMLAVLGFSVMLTTACGAPNVMVSVPQSSYTFYEPAMRSEVVHMDGTTIDGQSFFLADLDGPVVLNIWASWCDPCKEEWPILQEAAKVHPDIHFVGIDINDDQQSALSFVKTHGNNYPHVSDPNGDLTTKLNVAVGKALPMTFVLDRNHMTAARFIGKVSKESLAEVLSKLASES